MATSSNAFELLVGGADPVAIKKSTNASKNRKKKERRNQKKAAEQDSHGQPLEAPQSSPPEPSPRQAPHVSTKNLAQLTQELRADSNSTDCWPVWDGWLRQVRANADCLRRLWEMQIYSFLI
jgi:hypothetical protein